MEGLKRLRTLGVGGGNEEVMEFDRRDVIKRRESAIDDIGIGFIF